jgi:hypothetical protein
MTMATDLPSRPKRDPEEVHHVVEPTERVRSVADKADPRFEAARQKARWEAEVRARRKARTSEASGDEAEVSEPAEPLPEHPRKRVFSFNMTAGDAEEER